MIIKHRARRPIAGGPIHTVSVQPTGVGGLESGPTLGFELGDYRCLMTLSEWEKLCARVTEVKLRTLGRV